MVSSKATTVQAYIQSLPPERARVIRSVRKVIVDNLPKGYVETMNWGMITYEIPLKTYPITYNKKPLGYVCLAAQKNNFSLHLPALSWDKETNAWFRNEYQKKKKLDMGLGCVRFTTLEELPLDVIGKLVAKTSVKDYIRHYEETMKEKGRL